MAFDATFDLSINSVTKTLKRIRWDGYSSEYLLRSSTDEYRLFIRNSEVKSKKPDPLLRSVERHNVEVVHRIFATSSSPEIVRRAYTVFENYAGDNQTSVIQFASGVFADIGNAGIVTDQLGWQA